VCYHAFFFGFFYLLFSVALVFQWTWSCPHTPSPGSFAPRSLRLQDTSDRYVRLRRQGGCTQVSSPCCCLLKLPQLYAGCLYIHSNLTDRLGNAAPVPHLFLLQVRQSPRILPEIPDANAECIVHDISGSHAHAVRSPPLLPAFIVFFVSNAMLQHVAAPPLRLRTPQPKETTLITSCPKLE
jgi:hypothetical protein